MTDLLTRFAFPGVRNARGTDNPAAKEIKYLPRTGSNSGVIEYITFVYGAHPSENSSPLTALEPQAQTSSSMSVTDGIERSTRKV
jgi:hypothetical protein